jgi:hypothetical protein
VPSLLCCWPGTEAALGRDVDLVSELRVGPPLEVSNAVSSHVQLLLERQGLRLSLSCA